MGPTIGPWASFHAAMTHPPSVVVQMNSAEGTKRPTDWPGAATKGRSTGRPPSQLRRFRSHSGDFTNPLLTPYMFVREPIDGLDDMCFRTGRMVWFDEERPRWIPLCVGFFVQGQELDADHLIIEWI